MKNMKHIYFFIMIVSLMTLLTALIASNYFSEQKVLDEDFRALQEAYDTLYEEHGVLKDGYNELQQDYSRKTEQIEYLEYRIMSDDGISEELKQEIENNVPEEDN